MKPNDMDRVLLAHTPVEVVPKFGEFDPLQRNGHRFLVAADGMWLESKRAWGRVLWPMAKQSAVLMPFGRLEQSVELVFGKELIPHLATFADDAREADRDEVGGVVIWHEQTGSLRYERCESLHAGVGFLRARQPAVDEGEHIVVDLHSHGRLGAGFSGTDLKDTGSEMVLAGVVGRVDRAEPQIVLSLFACGLQVPCEVGDALRRACARRVEEV
jgi:PRTRC genetic system protein A